MRKNLSHCKIPQLISNATSDTSAICVSMCKKIQQHRLSSANCLQSKMHFVIQNCVHYGYMLVCCHCMFIHYNANCMTRNSYNPIYIPVIETYHITFCVHTNVVLFCVPKKKYVAKEKLWQKHESF